MNGATTELAPEKFAEPPAGSDDRAHPDTSRADEGRTDQVTALCQRLRETARQSGEATLEARRREGEAVLTEARRRAESEADAAVNQARTRLNRKVERRLQIARLDARASITRHCWQELNSVLDEAADVIRQLRDRDPSRYAGALVRLLRQAVGQVSNVIAHDPALAATAGWKPTPHSHDATIVQMNPHDVLLVRAALARDSLEQFTSDDVQFVESDIAAGFVVSAPSGSLRADESLNERLHRLDSELRLAAQELLFG